MNGRQPSTANLYWRFICGYSSIDIPDFRHQLGFSGLTLRTGPSNSSAPILPTPDPSRRFIVEVDASDV